MAAHRVARLQRRRHLCIFIARLSLDMTFPVT
jgi:hypothetical protein